MKQIFVVISFFVLQACVSIDQNAAKEAPPVTEDMSVSEALDAGIEFGGKTLYDAKKLFAKRSDWPEIRDNTTNRLDGAIITYTNSQLINLMHFYQASTRKADIKVFATLVASGRPMARILGWNLAANMPSPEIRSAIDAEFSRRMRDGEEEVLYLPAMSYAVLANRMTGSYTLLREGVFETGDEAFAKGMIALDRRKAADDLMDYLAKADVEELRQLNQKAVNVYTCLIALRHMAANPPSINHPHFNHLFLYAVSRNQGLADLANLVLERAVGAHTQYLAILLSRLPDWIQVAYVEAARRRMSPSVRTFISALKEATPHKSVVEEIRTIR